MATPEIDVTEMSRSDCALALMGAAAGTIMIYHRGDLIRARRRKQAVHELGMQAYALFESGWACLAQRRIRGHDGEFEYIAVKRKHIAFERVHP